MIDILKKNSTKSVNNNTYKGIASISRLLGGLVSNDK